MIACFCVEFRFSSISMSVSFDQLLLTSVQRNRVMRRLNEDILLSLISKSLLACFVQTKSISFKHNSLTNLLKGRYFIWI